MKMNKFKKRCYSKTTATAFMFACLGGLTACSDNDLDLTGNNENGTAVNFAVSMADKDAQAAAKANPAYATTRAGFAEQLSLQGLTIEDLTSRKIESQGNNDYFLIESTVPGIQTDVFDTTDPTTRATITTTATLGKFSAIGYRGASATSISTTPWFYNAEVNNDGTLPTKYFWAMTEPYAKFYAIYPQIKSSYNKLTLSPESNTSTPFVNIEVEEDVKLQKDLMTACSGTTPIQYTTQGTAPDVPLKFQHAMTAIRFKIGGHLSEAHKITKIEILGANSKGKFILPSEVKPTTGNSFNNSWKDVSVPKTFTLSGISVSTEGAINTTIVGKDNDNYTFYMIPQDVDGVVKVQIYFDNETTPAIKSTLKGSWKAGTTKTYAISQSATNLKYEIEATSPAVAASTATTTANYTIKSYMIDNGVQRAVKWKIIGYDADGDGNFDMNEKPDWLNGFTKTAGDGGTAGEVGTASITANSVDLLKDRNEKLKAETAVNNYNLANPTGAANIVNTANSYVISAPGKYRIPLVYGNAITNGSPYEESYTNTQAPKYLSAGYNEDLLLHHFVDHSDKEITSPYINKQNSTNPAKYASLLWSDVTDIITTQQVVQVDGTNDYLEFEVSPTNIANGNAVIAVTNGSGTIMWSWHLWFAPKSVLDPINFTSSGQTYGFATENLGWKYTTWTADTKVRKVKVKVEQESPAGTKKTATFDIEQAGETAVRNGYGTLFQWGRKDALPGTSIPAPGFGIDPYETITKENNLSQAEKDKMHSRTIGYAIQHPNRFLPKVGGGKLGWQYQQFINLWSTNSNVFDGSVRNSPKTIYDPSPAGFKVPDAHAFKDFKLDGATWNYGYTFKADGGKEIYFQAGGARVADGSLNHNGAYGLYWANSASLEGSGKLGYGHRMLIGINTISKPIVNPNAFGNYGYAYAVRPVKIN